MSRWTRALGFEIFYFFSTLFCTWHRYVSGCNSLNAWFSPAMDLEGFYEQPGRRRTAREEMRGMRRVDRNSEGRGGGGRHTSDSPSLHPVT